MPLVKVDLVAASGNGGGPTVSSASPFFPVAQPDKRATAAIAIKVKEFFIA